MTGSLFYFIFFCTRILLGLYVLLEFFFYSPRGGAGFLNAVFLSGVGMIFAGFRVQNRIEANIQDLSLAGWDKRKRMGS